VKEREREAISQLGTGTVDVTVENGLGQIPVNPSEEFTYPPQKIYHWYKSGVLLPEGESEPDRSGVVVTTACGCPILGAAISVSVQVGG
jgi:hypothetical protein